MKHWPILLTLLFLVGGERIHEGELVERRGIFYVPTEAEPFTGTVNEYHPNGELSFEGVYKDGKSVREVAWWDNGILMIESHYIDGELEGEFRSWHRNGEQDSVFNYKNGVRQGMQRMWHDNGQLAEEVSYLDGKPFSARRKWTRGGVESVQFMQ